MPPPFLVCRRAVQSHISLDLRSRIYPAFLSPPRQVTLPADPEARIELGKLGDHLSCTEIDDLLDGMEERTYSHGRLLVRPGEPVRGQEHAHFTCPWRGAAATAWLTGGPTPSDSRWPRLPPPLNASAQALIRVAHTRLCPASRFLTHSAQAALPRAPPPLPPTHTTHTPLSRTPPLLPLFQVRELFLIIEGAVQPVPEDFQDGQNSRLAAPYLASTGSSDRARRLATALRTREERPGSSDHRRKRWLFRRRPPKSPFSLLWTIQDFCSPPPRLREFLDNSGDDGAVAGVARPRPVGRGRCIGEGALLLDAERTISSNAEVRSRSRDLALALAQTPTPTLTMPNPDLLCAI